MALANSTLARARVCEEIMKKTASRTRNAQQKWRASTELMMALLATSSSARAATDGHADDEGDERSTHAPARGQVDADVGAGLRV